MHTGDANETGIEPPVVLADAPAITDPAEPVSPEPAPETLTETPPEPRLAMGVLDYCIDSRICGED